MLRIELYPMPRQYKIERMKKYKKVKYEIDRDAEGFVIHPIPEKDGGRIVCLVDRMGKKGRDPRVSTPIIKGQIKYPFPPDLNVWRFYTTLS